MFHTRLLHLLLAAVFLPLLSGCAARAYRPLPVPKDPGSFAEITVLRDKNINAMGRRVAFSFDGFTIVGLGIGQYVRLRVDPGTHALAYRTGFSQDSISLNFEANKRYYFIINNASSLHRLEEDTALPLIAGSKQVLAD